MMALVDELRAKQENSIEEKALEFAEQMEVEIIESAEKGYSGYKYKIYDENPDKHIMRSKYFAEKVAMLMDGVQVEYKAIEKQGLFGLKYYEHIIHFSW